MDGHISYVRGPARVLAYVAGVVTFIMMLHIAADVFMREVFEDPIDGTLEISASFYMVALVFLPLAYVTLTEGHILVELFTQKLRPGIVRRIDGVIALLGFLFVGLMTIGAVDVAIRRTRIRDTMETAGASFQVWPGRWIVPVGAGLMALALLIMGLRMIRGRPAAQDEAKR